MQVHGGLKHLIGPWMDLDHPRRGVAVQAADVAAGLVEAHQAVHRGDRIERRLNGGLQRIAGGRDARDSRESRARSGDLDEGAEQRPGAADASGHGCHRRPARA
jgi:hypothetical protein